jgi:preprotein translocase subunit SecE
MNKIREFIREVKVEIKKVAYPTKEELIGSTWVVITTVIVLSFFLGIVDFGLTKFVKIAFKVG